MNKRCERIACAVIVLAIVFGGSKDVHAAGRASLSGTSPAPLTTAGQADDIFPAHKGGFRDDNIAQDNSGLNSAIRNSPSSGELRPAAAEAPGVGLWISADEIMALPTYGAAWDLVSTAAYGNWGTPDLTNQNSAHDVNLLAGALVYARTGDPALRARVRDGIVAAKRTLDEPSEWQTVNGVLSASRQIGAYVISADLINLGSFDGAADDEFRSWLATIRTTTIGTHGRWKTIRYTCENAATNWGAFACASRIAASIYLGDTADVDRAASIIRAFFGNRSAYPLDAPGKNGYFEHTVAYRASWACNNPVWTGANPLCLRVGINIGGALVEDASRGGGCCRLQGSGIMYSWEALQGLIVSAELLYRTGRYGNPYNWSKGALKRSLNFMKRSGWKISSAASYVPWLANRRYGTSYPQPAKGTGRIMGWGNWLYQTNAY